MIRFALGNLIKSKVRTTLALVGLAVAIAGLVGLVSFSIGLRASLAEAADEVGGIMVLAAGNVSPAFSRLEEATVQKVIAVEGVGAVAREIFTPVLMAEGRSTIMDAVKTSGIPVLVGVDPVERTQLRDGGYFHQRIVEGRDLMSGENNEALIGRELALDWAKSIGAEVDVMDRKFAIVGIYETTNPFFSKMIIVNIEHARDILELRDDVCTALFVEAADPAQTTAVAKRIHDSVPGVDARSLADWAEVYGELSRNIDTFLAIITSFAVIVGAIGIANTMLMSVTERIGEFGVLRATGWSRQDVLKLVITESLAMALAGGALGVILGIGAGALITRFIDLQPVVSPSLAALAMGLAAITGTLGGIYPAWRAASLDVVAAIRFRDL